MKKLINNPDRVVTEMLQGLCEAEPELVYAGEGIEVVSRREKTPGKVGLVSGGGSGHEPAHAGYVGKGMLDAAVAGNVFASPSPDRILEGIHAADGGAGVLLIIKNYSGDIMNFQMAAELAQMEGIRTECVVVKDDVAVPDSTYSAGRRGIAGTVLVHKIAGAAAESGKNLDEVKRIAEKVNGNGDVALYPAGGGKTGLFPGRDRGGNRHGHPRGTGNLPGGPDTGRRDGKDASVPDSGGF